VAYAEKRGRGDFPWRVKFKKPDGTWGSASGFATETAALDHGREQEADVRRGIWRDPQRGQILFKDWALRWIEAQDVSSLTMERYRTRLRVHLIPAWGESPLVDIKPLKVEAWATALADGGMKPNTLSVTRGLFVTMLEDAVFEGLIDINPARKRKRRGRYQRKAGVEKVWVYEADVLRVANNLRSLRGEWAFVLVVLAAFTGMRWGELIGLKREFVWLDHGAVRVEWQLVEHDNGSFEELPPKYGSRRTLLIPPFLVAILADFLEALPEGQQHLFLTSKGTHPRRSGFGTLAFSEAVNGRTATYNGSKVRKAAVPTIEGAKGLTMHGLRHSHKVWIDEDGAPRVAAEERMGHQIQGVEGVYSHASAAMEAAIVAALQARWERLCRERPDLVTAVAKQDRLPFVSQKGRLRLVHSA
jgi:integrase